MPLSEENRSQPSLRKNLIGSFYQPKITFINTQFLDSLSIDEMRSGMAEIVKYGIIRDPELFNFLEENTSSLAKYSYAETPDLWKHIVTQSAKNKATVVEQDEHESGLRETLNFGHTFGHAIEAGYHYEGIRHGEAVALGMAAATFAAESQNLIPKKAAMRIRNLLAALKFNLKIPESDISLFLPHLYSDKKGKNGKLRFILPTAIGKTIVHDTLSEKDILLAYNSLS